jgi:hypothetical protein
MNPYLQTPLIDWRMDEEGNMNPYVPNPYGRHAGMVAGQPPKFKPQPNAMGQLPMPAPAQAPTPQPEQPMGLLGKLKKGAEGIGSDQILMALGSGMLGMSNNPQLQQLGMAGFGQIAKNRETQKALDMRNSTVEHLMKIGTPAAKKAAEYINATNDAKGGMKLYAEYGSVVQGSGAELSKKYGIEGLDPTKPYNLDTLTGKVTGIGSGGLEVNLGDKDQAQALATANAKYIGDTRTQYVDAGKQANALANSYARFLNAMGDSPTGGIEQTKQGVRSFLDSVGLGGFIDLDKYADSQQMIAATNDLVINELRKNKGPQTDFDAIFAKEYLPSLDKQGDTNRAIATYALSHAMFDQMLGSQANRLSIRDPEAESKIADLNDARINFSAFVQMKSGKPMYFSEYARTMRSKHDLSDDQIIQAWADFTKKQRY